MKHFTYAHSKMFTLLLYLLFVIGCAHHQATASEPTPHVPAPVLHEGLIREAREESDLLRSELAAIKIATAKQQAELRAARQQLDSLKTREETMASDVQKIREQLLIVEGERDQLRREITELQARSASLPNMQDLMAELSTIQLSVQQMVSNMKTLMADVIHIKQDMKHNQQKSQRGTASLTAFSMTKPNSSPAKTDSWTVAAGDTLWSISQHYETTVDTLISMNNLKSDLIVEGQTLMVPAVVSGEQRKQDEINETTKPRASTSEQTESP